MKKLITLGCILLTAIFVITILNPNALIAVEHMKKGSRCKYMDQLTEEQRETIRNTICNLRSSGTSPEDIRKKVQEMFKEYGIDLPDETNIFPGKRRHRPGRLMGKHFKNLSEEQRSALKEKVNQLREQGASCEEIHTEVQNMLKKYGIEVPADCFQKMGKRGGFLHGFPGIDLSKEQRMAIKEKVRSLRDNGADREEIHAAVREMLEGYGIEVPDKFDRHGRKWKGLTDEQRQAVRIKIREMRESGASREEIHEAIDKMIEEFGIEQEEDNQPSRQKLENSGDNFRVHTYPNPFNPETTILYTLKSPVQIILRIYDVQGQLVRGLVNDYQQPGNYSVRWDGLNQNGIQIPSGIYFLRIHAGDESLSQRLVMMK
jgi:DNA-binding transcriptional MerR regulator